MPDPSDQRRHPRLPFDTRVVLHADNATLQASTRNICLRGLFVDAPASLPPGGECTVSIQLQSGYNRAVIEARGKIVRQVAGLETDAAGIAVEFTELDPNSQELLWKVIRYNSPPTGTG